MGEHWEVALVEKLASSFSISEPHIQLSGWPAAAAFVTFAGRMAGPACS